MMLEALQVAMIQWCAAGAGCSVAAFFCGRRAAWKSSVTELRPDARPLLMIFRESFMSVIVDPRPRVWRFFQAFWILSISLLAAGASAARTAGR